MDQHQHNQIIPVHLEPESSRGLFVGDLSVRVADSDMYDIFGPYGIIEKLGVRVDQKEFKV